MMKPFCTDTHFKRSHSIISCSKEVVFIIVIKDGPIFVINYKWFFFFISYFHSLCVCVHPLPSFSSLLYVVTMLNWHEPTSYTDLLSIPKFHECCELFIGTEWNPLLTVLQGHDDELSLQFTLEFDGNRAWVGPLAFSISEESISQAMRFPRTNDRWFKSYKL